eukprot:EC724900.1.p1 GENE.EC724900.1~~EC724900.1.p1  ORF type:complete len:160 (+),score=16.23 EC724900.1:63-542(+)
MKREISDSAFEIFFVELMRQAKTNPKGLPAATYVEQIAFVCGQKFLERSCDKKRILNQTELIKYVCREFWTEVYSKQMDQLRRNLQQEGNYVLTDLRFRGLRRFESMHKEDIELHLAFACGMLRGALAALNVTATVTAEVAEPPACAFIVTMLDRPAAA